MLTAAEVRARGDATNEQRAHLRNLIRRKAVTDEWVQRFYADVVAAKGLSVGRAAAAQRYLESLADRGDEPTYATPEQANELRELIRTRIVPGILARMWIDRLDAGRLTHIEASHAIADYRRRPIRTFTVPADPTGDTPGIDGPDGYFGIAGPDGRVRCYRIHTKQGRRVVDQITDVVDQGTGKRHTRRRRVSGWHATQILRTVHADVATAARLHGQARKHCSACNQPLHDETQDGYPHGYGPDCWTELQEHAAPTPTEGTTEP